MKDPLKILVIRLSSLGDILHTLPAFFDLRHSFPDARIDWVVALNCRFLLSAVKGIDTVHIFDKAGIVSSPFNRPARYPVRSLIRKLRAEHYDYAIDFQGLLKTAFLGFASGAAVRIGFPKELVRERPSHWLYHRTPAPPQQPVHVLDLNRMLAACAGARPATVPFDPVLDPRDPETVDSLLEEKGLAEFVVINPGGGWPSKIWKPEYFGKLARRIESELNLPVVVTTGPGEEFLYEKLAAHCDGKPPIHVRVSFLQLIPLFKKARLLIGGDTGPLHLACALDVPVVGIYGPTSPVRNGPWKEADETVVNPVPCSGCHKRICPTDNACMEIPVDNVFAAVIRRLNPDES